MIQSKNSQQKTLKMSRKILLVDDEPGLREAVQAYLEDSGFHVDIASNPNEGWDILQLHLPDLVITDIMMPQVDGYQFLQKKLNSLTSDKSIFT